MNTMKDDFPATSVEKKKKPYNKYAMFGWF